MPSRIISRNKSAFNGIIYLHTSNTELKLRINEHLISPLIAGTDLANFLAARGAGGAETDRSPSNSTSLTRRHRKKLIAYKKISFTEISVRLF